VSQTDDILREFLEQLAAKQGTDVATAASSLIGHRWGEIEERNQFYSRLQPLVTAEWPDPVAIHECIKKWGKTLLGGHNSLRVRVRDFIESANAGEHIRNLIANAAPESAPAVDAFISAAVANGFVRPDGKAAGGDVTYFASILLTAALPDIFVECRITRWEWMSNVFKLSPMPKGSYGERLCAAATMAKELVATPTFQKYLATEHPNWTAGALAWLFQQFGDYRLMLDPLPPDRQISVDDATKEAFHGFRNDPRATFVVSLRRRRAEQIRELLSDPQAIDLETFNREVWNFHSEARIGDEVITENLGGTPKVSVEELQRYKDALESGALSLHGNYMWGSATRIFGPMLQGGDDQRLQLVRQALIILNDSDLEPLKKAEEIMKVSGFGRNIATGLVMTFHPTEFSIWNDLASKAINKLGYTAKDLHGYETLISQLKAALGADDFLELDYFLLLLEWGEINLPGKSQSWWVCQGTMYDAEHRGGYVFAPTQTKDGKVVSHHANVGVLQTGQKLLHYSNGAIRSIGTVTAPAKETTRPDVMPGEETGTRGNLVGIQYDDLQQPIALSEIPEAWRSNGEQPFNKNGAVKQGYLFRLSHDFFERFSQRFADRFKKAPVIQPAARQIVKISPGEGAKYWDECRKNGYICVGWGDVGDLREFKSQEAFREKFGELYAEGYGHEATTSRKANELWKLTTLRPGDIVIANRGVSHVLAQGIVLDPPYDFNPSTQREDHSHLIRVRWDESIAKDIPRQGFWGLTVVTDVAPDLYAFITGAELLRSEDSGGIANYVEPTFATIYQKITENRLRISERTLRRYHLSLKTRGFVILCGLSGCGKTWLAQLYAKLVGAEQLLVPVAPNWTTNEDLLGYFNPIDNHYHDTDFSRFLRKAAEHFEDARAAGVIAKPYHLILDEMNLARVEYYFAKFLSGMEVRARDNEAQIDLGEGSKLLLPPNLFFIGTVNMDETTHGFADKVYDRSQLIEMPADRDSICEHIGEVAYAEALLGIWDAVATVAPFAYRVLNEMKSYIDASAALDTSWEQALDEQLLQKVLPKIKGAERQVQECLEGFIAKSEGKFPLSHVKATRMLEVLRFHGITSYF